MQVPLFHMLLQNRVTGQINYSQLIDLNGKIPTGNCNSELEQVHQFLLILCDLRGQEAKPCFAMTLTASKSKVCSGALCGNTTTTKFIYQALTKASRILMNQVGSKGQFETKLSFQNFSQTNLFSYPEKQLHIRYVGLALLRGLATAICQNINIPNLYNCSG